ncbi:hypothetical protein [Flagellimonas eckloniae]|nr:hypothetical protein [Allomuricauda eckloniae]
MYISAKSGVIILMIGLISLSSTAQSTIPYTKGRIVVSSDGNEHDHDDWAATPLTLALLASAGLQDSLVVYTFSDHIWGSNQEKENGKAQMLESVLKGKEIFNFKNSNFIEAVADSTSAIRAITQEIDKSDKHSPLNIIAAGPMHVVGRALENANPSKLKYVRLISHSKWNNEHADKPYDWEKPHSGWTWDEIKENFESNGLAMDKILDQNGGDGYQGFKAPIQEYNWVKTSAIRDTSPKIKKQMDWLYDRLLTCVKKGDFDPSDAGMVVYLLTGKEKTDPSDARKLIENPTH